jgi:citrate lyase subunit beta/citryl-CoA lyase
MTRRSVLFTPGDRPEMLRKAPGAGADVVVFDLEDAVAPARKDEAREAVWDCFADPEFDPDAEVCVRVNDPETADDDLDVVLEAEGLPDSVMLPKADDADDVETLSRLLRERDRKLPVIAIVESASGVLSAEAIAAHDRTDAVAFGAEDLSADLGATRTAGGEEVLYAREHVVLAASAAGVDAIDTVFTDVRDTEGMREAAAFARQLGYDGKMAIHPGQVDPINEAWTPAPDRVEWARKVLEAREEAEAEDRGVFRVDDEMIDAPLIAQAERVLALARAAGELED